MHGNKTYQDLYRYLLRSLETSLEAKELFSYLTGIEFSRLPLEGNNLLSTGQWAAAEALLARREAGEPLQYLLGEWGFYGLTLAVGEGVLIPRSDTEVLVDLGLELLASRQAPLVLDLCAGSGAIGLALATQRPDAKVSAVELSPEAFAFLDRNNQAYGNPLHAIQADVLLYQPPQPLDLIVSNPPYIPSGELPLLQKEVQWEPYQALDGGKDGLDFYRFLTQRYFFHLKPEGFLAFEVGIKQGEAVAELLALQGFAQIQTRADLSGIPRVVYGQRPAD